MARAVKRSTYLQLRVTPEERDRVAAAAGRVGVPVSEFVRRQLGAVLGGGSVADPAGSTGSSGPVGRESAAEAVSGPEVASGRPLPSAAWICRVRARELSGREVAAELAAGRVRWDGEDLIVGERRFPPERR